MTKETKRTIDEVDEMCRKSLEVLQEYLDKDDDVKTPEYVFKSLDFANQVMMMRIGQGIIRELSTMNDRLSIIAKNSMNIR